MTTPLEPGVGPSSSLSRRAALSALAVGVASAGGLAAAPAAGADARHGRDDDRDGAGRLRVPLPAGIRPEGITTGPGGRFYVGSLTDGRIVTGDLRRGGTRVLLPGVDGGSVRGLFRDRRTGLVWAAASFGATGVVLAVDDRTGEVALRQEVPGAAFLNDLVVTGRAVWVTDSALDRLTRIPLTGRGVPTGGEPTFLPLGGPWPTAGAFRANGIRELPDCTLLVDHSTAGGLWQVDPWTGTVRPLEVTGTPAIVAGDGLELRGRTVFVVRGSGGSDVTVARLRRTRGGWSARVVGVLSSPALDVPSTASLALGSLWAVNARFGVASPQTADYWVTRLRLRSSDD